MKVNGFRQLGHWSEDNQISVWLPGSNVPIFGRVFHYTSYKWKYSKEGKDLFQNSQISICAQNEDLVDVRQILSRLFQNLCLPSWKYDPAEAGNF